jgi:hypothetical protein
MTTYDIIYDVMLLDEELEKRGMSRNYELFDGDDGYVSFLEEKVNELEKYWKEKGITNDSYLYSIYETTEEFVNKNAERWKRELRGENLYKVKVVLELDVASVDKLDAVSNVKELFRNFCDKLMEDYGAIEDARVVNAVGREVNE